MISEKLCIVYGRVSTSSQNISSQIKIGLAKTKSLGYEDHQVMVIEDDGVSSMAIKYEYRDGLMSLRQLIRENKVGDLIVYDRDRIARDMIEYLEFVDDLIKFKVNVVFSNPTVDVFSSNLAREAELALYAETEGKKIISRTQQASKYYCRAPFGYIKIGEKAATRYEFSTNEEIEMIKTMFHEFNSIESRQEYQQFKKRYIGQIPGNLEKTLTHPYYAGHIFVNDGVEKLRHVQAIVDVEQIKQNVEKLKKWGYGEKKKALNSTPIELSQTPLICDVCGNLLRRRSKQSEVIFSCHHKDSKTRSKNVQITSIRLHELINQNLSETVNKLDLKLLRETCRVEINKALAILYHNRNKLIIQYNKSAAAVRSDRKQLKKLKIRLDSVSSLKVQLNQLDQECRQLNVLKTDINNFTTMVLRNLHREVSYCSVETIRALISSINLGFDYVTISNRFNEFEKGVS